MQPLNEVQGTRLDFSTVRICCAGIQSIHPSMHDVHCNERHSSHSLCVRAPSVDISFGALKAVPVAMAMVGRAAVRTAEMNAGRERTLPQSQKFPNLTQWLYSRKDSCDEPTSKPPTSGAKKRFPWNFPHWNRMCKVFRGNAILKGSFCLMQVDARRAMR